MAHSDSGRDGWVTVHVGCVARAVQVTVTDDGSATSAPAVQVPGFGGDGGRGLWLVALLAARWGARHDEAGTVVW